MSERKTDWLAGLFSDIDAQDTPRFLAYLRPDAQFRFGSAPAVKGTEEICAAVDGFFATIAGLSHVIGKSWSYGDTVVCEGEVTYRRHDGSEITLPFANVFDMDGDSIARYKIYMDIGPLYAQ